MTHAELLAQYTEIGWLGRPSGDPLRRIAERALERAVEATSGGAEERSRSRDRPPWSAFPIGIGGESRG
jgi:hypothetical protein